MTFEELTTLHQRHLQGLRRHPSTLNNQRRVQLDFAAFCQSQLGLAGPRELRREHLAAYLARLRESPLTPMVRYSRQRLLRTWLAWATYQGHLLLDPAQGLAWKHPSLLPRGAPSESQVERFLAAPDTSLLGQRDRALVEFLYGTGARIGEAVAVDLADLDLAHGRVLIRQAKGGSPRWLPLGPQLVAVLQHYVYDVRPGLERSDPAALWLTHHGRRLPIVQTHYRFRKWSAECGLKLTPHSLRHAFATHLLARGAPLVAVQRLLGHQTLGMTQRYTHLVPVDLQQAVQQHHPRGKKKGRRPRKSEE